MKCGKDGFQKNTLGTYFFSIAFIYLYYLKVNFLEMDIQSLPFFSPSSDFCFLPPMTCNSTSPKSSKPLFYLFLLPFSFQNQTKIEAHPSISTLNSHISTFFLLLQHFIIFPQKITPKPKKPFFFL